MRLEIDWTLCDGHGLCARLLPERVSLANDGFPIINDENVDDDLLRNARRAVAVCPQLALRLERRRQK